jgi:hypothetical protein
MSLCHCISKKTRGWRCEALTSVFLSLCAFLPAHSATAGDAALILNARPPRDIIWGFESTVERYNLRLPDESTVAGMAGRIGVAYGRIRDNQWLMGRFHFLAGPFDLARQGQFDADFSGTSIDFEYGSAFPGRSLRGASVPTLSIAFGYTDLNGRNIGDNRRITGSSTDNENYRREQGFQIHMGLVTVTPALGWTWTKPPRPQGNEPELLSTRIESAYARIGTMIPLYSRGRVEVTKRSADASPRQTASKYKATGHIVGYSLIASAGVWLGI